VLSEVILYLYSWCYASSWNRKSIVHWKCILMFVIVWSVYCTDCYTDQSTVLTAILISLLYRLLYWSVYCTDCYTDQSTVQTAILISLLYRLLYWSVYCTDCYTDQSTVLTAILISLMYRLLYWSVYCTDCYTDHIPWASVLKALISLLGHVSQGKCSCDAACGILSCSFTSAFGYLSGQAEDSRVCLPAKVRKDQLHAFLHI
jgi:hypothetical protein